MPTTLTLSVWQRKIGRFSTEDKKAGVAAIMSTTSNRFRPSLTDGAATHTLLMHNSGFGSNLPANAAIPNRLCLPMYL